MTRRLRAGSFSVKAIPKASAATAGAKGSRRLANGRFRSIARKEGAAAATFTLPAGALPKGGALGSGQVDGERWVWCGELVARRVENEESGNRGRGFAWKDTEAPRKMGGKWPFWKASNEEGAKTPLKQARTPGRQPGGDRREATEMPPKNKGTERQIEGSEITMRMTGTKSF